MIEDKIARVKVLIQKREEIDAELSALFGIVPSKRGRPRKDAGANGDAASEPTITGAGPVGGRGGHRPLPPAAPAAGARLSPRRHDRRAARPDPALRGPPRHRREPLAQAPVGEPGSRPSDKAVGS